jgi:TRAP-type C4-dicarboxylate transport system substrate-binding protein
MKAAAEAGVYHKETMSAQVAGIRKFLTTEGGMKLSNPDKSGFIAAAQKLQDKYAEEKDQDFQDLVKAIRNAAN